MNYENLNFGGKCAFFSLHKNVNAILFLIFFMGNFHESPIDKGDNSTQYIFIMVHLVSPILKLWYFVQTMITIYTQLTFGIN